MKGVETLTTRKEQARHTKRKIFDIEIQLFAKHSFDKVAIKTICEACQISIGGFYHHYKSKGTQIITRDQFLPLKLINVASNNNEDNYDNNNVYNNTDNDYIIEPDRVTIIKELLPKVLKVKLFTTFIDSATSEHAARMTAMQIANDNADNLIDELNREYNKLRQESITNELLDIVGGSFGRS